MWKNAILPLKMELFTLEFRVFRLFFYDIFYDFILWKFVNVGGENKNESCVCENINVSVCFTPARALRTRGTSGTRPPTSCRAFLLRTLPPPPHPWIINVQTKLNDDKKPSPLISFDVYYSGVLGGKCPTESSPALHERGEPPPPPPPPKDPKDQKHKK
jgi:hypothetical protein